VNEFSQLCKVAITHSGKRYIFLEILYIIHTLSSPKLLAFIFFLYRAQKSNYSVFPVRNFFCFVLNFIAFVKFVICFSYALLLTVCSYPHAGIFIIELTTKNGSSNLLLYCPTKHETTACRYLLLVVRCFSFGGVCCLPEKLSSR